MSLYWASASESNQNAVHHLEGWPGWMWGIMIIGLMVIPMIVTAVISWLADRMDAGEPGILGAIAVWLSALISARMIWHVQRHVPDGRWATAISLLLFCLVGVICFFVAAEFGVELDPTSRWFWIYVGGVAVLWLISTVNDCLARIASGIPTSVPTLIMVGILGFVVVSAAANDRR